MARVRFRSIPSGMAQVRRSREVGSQMVDVVQDAQRFAVANSPVDTGEYASSWRTSAADVIVPGVGRSAGARLYNTAEHAMHVERRNGDQVLQRTIEHINARY